MMSKAAEPELPALTVSDFLKHAPAELGLRLLAGERGCATRRITSARIQNLGLALAGFTNYVPDGRVQIVGQSEAWFLDHRAPPARREAISGLALDVISCLLMTNEIAPSAELLAAAEQAGLPVLQTPLINSLAISVATEYLRQELAPRESRHGVLLAAYGLGVLIEGESGIGKSECALDLIMRGHRLIADDVVEVRRTGPEELLGSAPEMLRELMEIRGLGIINIRELLGVAATSDPKPIGLSIRLEHWHKAGAVERLGIDERTIEILGVHVPHVLLPVSPGRNLSTLIETALRVHLLRVRGHSAARQFAARHDAELLRAGGAGVIDPPPDELA